MFHRTKILCLGLLSCALVLTSGCVSLETQEEISVREFIRPERKGVYHKVKKGETLWRIAKTYNVPIKDVIRTNNIPETAKIEKNQLLFIPGVDTVKEISLDVDKAQNEFIWPIKGKVIRYFHHRQGGRVNKGIDIRGQEGDVVKAARTGRVVFADYLSGYGYTVILDHLDGLYSVYAKNSKLSVKLGELVLRNGDIAQVGRSSNLACLHFQIRKESVEDNPLYYLP
ncbi:MAG: peptidoglycan DD-metalloendopeptidase family protein [Candidatus Omnitrophica bacterium]|nr:peptidoglycan DD-metalloendopeptidase family protein [Candidatus Omnitrophota bacterium]